MFDFNFLYNLEKEIRSERDLLAEKIAAKKKEELKQKYNNLSEKQLDAMSKLGKNAEEVSKKYEAFLKSESFPSGFQVFIVSECHCNPEMLSDKSMSIKGVFTTFGEAYKQVLEDVQGWKDEEGRFKYVIDTEDPLDNEKVVNFSMTGYTYLKGICVYKDIYKIHSQWFFLNPKNTFIVPKINEITEKEEYFVYEL